MAHVSWSNAVWIRWRAGMSREFVMPRRRFSTKACPAARVAWNGENRITLRRVGQPHDELQVNLQPRPGGTLLVLLSRRPRPQPGTASELITGAIADELHARALRYKETIE